VTKASVWDKVCEIGFSDPDLEPKPEPKGTKKKKKGRTRAEIEAAKPDRGYDPIICKKCKQELYYLVSVVVKCPMGWKDLTKNGLRYKAVQVVGAKWGDTQFFCGCDGVQPNTSKDNITYKAGKRWTKGLVPNEPHRRTRNPSPIRKKRKKNA